MVECPCGLHRPERLPIRRLGGPGVLVPRPDRQRGPGQAAELAAGAEGPLQPRNRLSGESWLSGRDPGDAAMGLPATIAEMNWNDAAEDMLQQIVAQTPRPVREAAETQLRKAAERMAEDAGKNRVGRSEERRESKEPSSR